MTAPPPDRVWLRLGGAFVAGCLVTPVAAMALLERGFGGTASGLPYVAALLGFGTLALAVVHRISGPGGAPSGLRSVGWGFAALVLSLVLVGTAATIWQRSGSERGGWPAPWWLVAGVGFTLAAALLTRRTVLPAAGVLVLLGVGALAISWDTLTAPGQPPEQTSAPPVVSHLDGGRDLVLRYETAPLEG